MALQKNVSEPLFPSNKDITSSIILFLLLCFSFWKDTNRKPEGGSLSLANSLYILVELQNVKCKFLLITRKIYNSLWRLNTKQKGDNNPTGKWESSKLLDPEPAWSMLRLITGQLQEMPSTRTARERRPLESCSVLVLPPHALLVIGQLFRNYLPGRLPTCVCFHYSFMLT